ncbi:RsmB/NOP family class I SAM-dependent RNA methyltransferase [Lachnospiraceae bacterium 46-15]
MKLPQSFTSSMRELLGNEYEEYLTCFDEPSARGLRVNTAKISVEDFLKLTPFTLEPVPWTKNGFYYSEAEPVTKHPHYYAGLYYIQEPSAMIPASRLPVEPGDWVLDLCAAPGGKATELAARLGENGLLAANDISNSRAKGLLKNLELFGCGNMLVLSEAPEKLLEYFEACFDKILIDAPCSGEGMFRREPAMVKSWENRGPEYYAGIQREILRCAVKLLRPGGKLLYSTCTFSETENEQTILRLLDSSPDMMLIPMEGYESFAKSRLPHCIRVYPHKVRGEGHFAALLQKEGAADTKETACQRADKAEKRKAEIQEFPTDFLEFLAQIPRLTNRLAQMEIRRNRIYLMPDRLPDMGGLRFLRTGLLLGECVRNRFEPSQALAMWLTKEDFPQTLSLASDDDRTMRYLKGESVVLTEDESHLKKGWVLVCTDGYPLGWAKAAGGTLKNKYYPGWRVQ